MAGKVLRPAIVFLYFRGIMTPSREITLGVDFERSSCVDKHSKGMMSTIIFSFFSPLIVFAFVAAVGVARRERMVPLVVRL